MISHGDGLLGNFSYLTGVAPLAAPSDGKRRASLIGAAASAEEADPALYMESSRMRWALSRLFNLGRAGDAGMSLVEVLYATGIFAITVASVISGLYVANHNANWSTYNQIATKYAGERMEQVHSARWSPNTAPPIDELTTSNFPPDTVVLDPLKGGASTIAATRSIAFTAMTDPSSNQYKVFQVSVVWRYPGRGIFTNRFVGIHPPD